MSVLSNSTLNLDLDAVGQSWTLANKDSYLFSHLPQFKVKGRNEGAGTTTYQLPSLENSLIAAKLPNWESGMSAPERQILTSGSVTVTPTGITTKELARPLNRKSPHVFADLERNIVPICMAQLFQQIDLSVVTYLTSAAYGSQKTFSGNSAIDAPSDFANQNVLRDFMTNLQPLRKYRGDGRVLACIMDVHVAGVLAGHPSLTGAGTGSAVASQLPFAAVEQILKDRIGVDEVIITGTAINTARTGQTATIKNTANGLLWFGLLDRRGEMDLSSDGSFDAPDGGLQIAMARQPEVINYKDEAREEDIFCGKASFQVLNPRSASGNAYFGHFYKTNGNNGIFTSLPA